MNSLNSIHNFKKKISVVASATIPFWEPTADTDISYATYSSSPSSNINAGTGLTGSNQAVVYDYANGLDLVDYWIGSPELKEIGDFWTIVLLCNIDLASQIWTMSNVSSNISSVSNNPCILVSIYGIEWSGTNIYNNSPTVAWFNNFDSNTNHHLIYDSNSDGNAITDDNNNIYNWYDVSVIQESGSNIPSIFTILSTGTLFSTWLNPNATELDTNVTLRTLPFGTIATIDPDADENDNLIVNNNPSAPDTYDRSAVITFVSFADYSEYSIVITRYTNDSLPQILKTRLFS